MLTTQLFFPNVAANAGDSIYDRECQVWNWRKVDGRRLATFDFVLDL